MKLDALTIGAVGFAAFAAFAYLKPKPTSAGASAGASTQAGAWTGFAYDDPWNSAKVQKNASAGALWQNTDYLSGQAWAQPNIVTGANLLTGATAYSGIWQP